MNIHMKTCSLCSCWVRVWRRRHIHAGFRWFYHREEVSKKSAAGTRSAERWHFEETLKALRRTRDREQRGRETITDTQKEDLHWSPAWCAPTSEHVGNHPAKQSPTVREGRKFRGAPPLKCYFRVSYVTFQGGKNAEIKWIWHFCDEALLRAAHVAAISEHSFSPHCHLNWETFSTVQKVWRRKKNQNK